MKHLITPLTWIGLHFSPDNYVVPVLRMERYHRVRGPGFFWIWPFFERTLPAVKTSLYVGAYQFENVLSKDGIPFTMRLTILFSFNPEKAIDTAKPVLVKLSEGDILAIVRDYANQGLRRFVSRFGARDLCQKEPLTDIEQDLTEFLAKALAILGIEPLPTGGLLIKETIPSEAFQRAMQSVTEDSASLDLLQRYPVRELLDVYKEITIAKSFKDNRGQSVLIMGSPDEANTKSIAMDMADLAPKNGHYS